MNDWAAVQRDFAAALADGRLDGAAARWLDADPADAARRLSLYRANVAAGAARALAGAFPVLRELVGAECFDGLARTYQRDHPSTSGDLHEHGAALGDFLAGFAPLAGLPYLADLARLEWAVHRAGGAADAVAWDGAALAGLSPAQQAALRFRFAPGCALVASPHPVARIWQVHQAGQAGLEVDLPGLVDLRRDETAWVARHGFRVVVEAVAPGTAAFLAAVLGGARFGDALDDASTVDPDFDPGPLLAGWAAANVLTGVLPAEPDVSR